MKREEILKLIEEKEAKDVETKARFADIEKRTEEVFHIIKQDVMDMVVEFCIDRNYLIYQEDIRRFVCESIINSENLPLNKDICKVKCIDGSCFLVGETVEAVEFLFEINIYSIVRKTINLMKLHGFKEESFVYTTVYTTTKENLLSFSEIISEDVDKGKKRFAQAAPPVRYDTKDDGFEVIKGLEFLIGVVILFILLTSVYIFS